MSNFGKGVSQGMGTGVGCILAILTFGLGLYAILLHLFTVASIWTAHGAIIGIISFFLPGIAEVYLLFMAAAVNPNGWGNNYTAYFAIFVVAVIVRTVFIGLVGRFFPGE